MPKPAQVGKLIKAFRQSLHVRQAEFGRLIDPQEPISQSSISAYERGERFPGRKIWIAITEFAKQHNFPLTIHHLYRSDD